MTDTGPNGWLRAHTDKVGITQPVNLRYYNPAQCSCGGNKLGFGQVHMPTCRAFDPGAAYSAVDGAALGARATGSWKVWAVVVVLGASIGFGLAFLLPWPTP